MESITQHKLAHKLTEATTTLFEESEYVQIRDAVAGSSLPLRVVLSVETLCREYIQIHKEQMTHTGPSRYEPFVSSLAFRLFILVSTEAASQSDPVHLIPKLKQIIQATLLRTLPQ